MIGKDLLRLRAICYSAALGVIIGGCGSDEDAHPPTVPVQGTVTFKGQPVPTGTVTFQPEGGRPAVGDIQPDGTYHLSSYGEKDGAVLGVYKVTVISNTGDPTQMPSSPGYVPPKDIVPKKYASPGTSGLQVEVVKEKMTYDLKLE